MRAQLSPISSGSSEERQFYTLEEPKSVLLPLVILLVLVVLTALWWFSQPREVTSITLNVVSSLDNSPVSGAKVFLSVNGEEVAAKQTFSGRTSFSNVPKSSVSIKIVEEGFSNYESSFNIGKSSFLTIRLDPLFLPVSSNRIVEIISTPGFAGPSTFDFLSAEETTEINITAKETGEFIQKQVVKGEIIEFKGFSVVLLDVSKNSVSISINSSSKELIPRTILASKDFFDVSNLRIELLEVRINSALLKFSEKLFDNSVVLIDYPARDSVVSEPFLTIQGRILSNFSVEKVLVSFEEEHWFVAEGTKDWRISVIPPLKGQYVLNVKAITVNGFISSSEPTNLIISPCKQLFYSGNSSEKLDLVLAPSGFTAVSDLLDQSDLITNYVFSREPFNKEENQKKINVYYYPFDVKCSVFGSEGIESRLWSCDLNKDFFASCPFTDVSTVVINSEHYGGSGGSQIFLTKDYPELFLHEFGHSFGLADRYCCDGYYVQSNPRPNLFNTRFECFNVAGRVFNNTCRSIGVRSGIAQENWHEVFEDSLMQSLDYPDFAPSDLWGINYVLDSFK
ncbi:MAG: hypothetical protein ABH803_01250 [Candidatus Micrarchaeota archaeon]